MNMRMCAIVVCAALAVTEAAPASCGSGARKPEPNTNTAATVTPTYMPTPAASATPPAGASEASEMKVLAQGQHGKIEEPFVVVAREAEVYGELRALVEGLPELGAGFFETRVVVAAFAGARRSGGYGVEFKRGADRRIHVTETTPPKGAMVTMALTQPFKVVSVEVGEEGAVELELGGAWGAQHWRFFRVASGEFQTGGGFAGHFEKLKLEGGVSLARHGKLLTLMFDVKGVGGKSGRALKETASGIARAAERFEIPRMDAGTLVDHPRPPLRVAGGFDDGGGKLSLSFESLPTNVADGFGGSGKLEATATGPAPPKSKPRAEM